MLFSHEPQIYLALGALLFSMGLFTVLTRRNIVGILIGVELLLNASGINFIAFSAFSGVLNPVEGHLFALFIIILAAAEAVVALAILLVVYRQRKSVDINELRELKG